MPQFIGSSTPINTGSNYTSAWINTDLFASLSGSIFTDRAATLFVEQSGDRTNADVSASYAISASTGTKYIETIVLPYARLRVTNASGTNQTVLRLFSYWIPGDR